MGELQFKLEEPRKVSLRRGHLNRDFKEVRG